MGVSNISLSNSFVKNLKYFKRSIRIQNVYHCDYYSSNALSICSTIGVHFDFLHVIQSLG
jgi:hypothetical protein